MFHSARLKLTAWYLLIIMIVSFFFSFLIYRALVTEVERFEKKQIFKFEKRLEEFPEFIDPRKGDRIRIISPAPELIEETKQRVLLILVVINATILILAGGLAYLLSGHTLHPIQEMVDEQNRFISDASHELKTPLTSLKTAFEVYLRGKSQTLQESKEIIQESLEEVNKLQALSESLLNLAQYEIPNGHSHFKKVKISEVIVEAIHKIKKVAEQKDISIFKTIEDVEVRGNKESLVNLLIILLDNAIKYSKNRTAVQITSEKKDSSVSIAVTDEGIGIKESDQQHIFDRFYRADTSRSKVQAPGYGLGLPIAKKIIELHGGTITVKSRLGEGTSVTITFPFNKK